MTKPKRNGGEKMKNAAKDLAKYVYDYAMDNYTVSGWSMIVECKTLKEIEEELIEANATTKKAALAAFEVVVDIWGERMADARYYAEGGY
jgi:hypothetical protein